MSGARHRPCPSRTGPGSDPGRGSCGPDPGRAWGTGRFPQPQAARLACRRVRGQDDADRRTAAVALVDRHHAVQGPRSLRQLFEAAAAALAGRIVRDLRLDTAFVALADADRKSRRWAAVHRLVQRLANDLVERRLGLL